MTAVLSSEAFDHLLGYIKLSGCQIKGVCYHLKIAVDNYDSSVVHLGNRLHLVVQNYVVLLLRCHITGSCHLIAKNHALILYLNASGIQLPLIKRAKHNS